MFYILMALNGKLEQRSIRFHWNQVLDFPDT